MLLPKMSRARVGAITSCAVTLLLALPSSGRAQHHASLRIVDDIGEPVAFAVVRLARGVSQIADSAGRLSLRPIVGDSIRIDVRRIGYREFSGWSHREADAEFRVVLPRIARPVTAVEVAAPANTPLARTGFYDRVERTRRGAFVAEFIPPEELESRNAMTFSRFLEGRRVVRVGRTRDGQAVLLGRGGCGMTIILDGQRLTGTMEEAIVGEAPTSIDPSGTRPPSSGFTIDRVVAGAEVMAIEIYASTANAPAELIPLGGRGSCGMVVIWTGGRH